MTKVCGACGEEKDKKYFSNKQWSINACRRRCKECSKNDIPLCKTVSEKEGFVSESEQQGKKLLEASSLPPFEPSKNPVMCTNGLRKIPMSALKWAFSCNVPSMSRVLMMGSSNENLAANATPSLQWNYTMFHLAHHYEVGPQKKFSISEKNEAGVILVEVTDLRACPDDIDDMNAFPRKDFFDPVDPARKASLGPIPVLFVRYLYKKESPQEWNPTEEVVRWCNGQRIMNIVAASTSEIEYALKMLKRGESFLPSAQNASDFKRSILYPGPVEEKGGKAQRVPYVCAFCDCTIDKRPTPSCSRCSVTYYCGKECRK
mmetsp:Transcript_14719/g.31973  ORF Transcript_14719/g.31973 Transcript_14719/m.31973 type:complete len:317 (+) Transcript_14719:63-1013(+)